jgi:hypothetical protein
VGAPRRGFLTLTRLGFAARGIMYLLVAWLALRVGRAEDAGGALAYLASGRGHVVLAAMAVGFAAYGLWRLADAGFDLEGRGSEAKALGVRAVAAGSGLVHLGLALASARLAFGYGHGGGSSRKAETASGIALHLPGGKLILFAAAAVLLAAGIAQFVKAARRRFLRHLQPGARDAWWVIAAGCCGYAARGAVFATAAWLALRAGLDRSPGEAGGLGDALKALPGAAETAVAGGLALFGAYCLIEGWYRILPDPDVKRRAKSAVARLRR